MPFFKGKNMYRYVLVLDNGGCLYYDNLKEARKDKTEFGGTIYNRNGKIVY